MDVRDERVDPARLREAGDELACLRAVTEGQDLTEAESEALFSRIMDGEVSPIVIGALLAALRTKGETVAEMTGAARVMRRRSERVHTSRGPLVDTCGTGGDCSGTFNISTTAAFVVAAAGIPVAKHGNRAASSRSGSADVLEALGVVVDLSPEEVGAVLDAVGIGFLFAPRFHPAMRHAVGARKEIGIRTLFNLLGPLTNPAGADRQVIGVPTVASVEPVGEVLRALGSHHALVVHGLEGLDEISVSGPTRIAVVREGEIAMEEVEPADLGVDAHPLEDLAGGDADDNARILRSILEGRGSDAQRAIVSVNAGAGIYVGDGAGSLREGVERARSIIETGAGARVLESLVATTRTMAADREAD